MQFAKYTEETLQSTLSHEMYHCSVHRARVNVSQLKDS